MHICAPTGSEAQLAGRKTFAKYSFLAHGISPCALPPVSSVEGGIRAARRCDECDRQDLGVPHSGRWNVRPMRTLSELHQGYAQVPGETDVLLCRQCPN